MKILWTLPFVLLPCAAAASDDAYFDAMRDELSRTHKKLRVEGSVKPYFTAYWLMEKNTMSFSASFGEALSSVPSAPAEPMRRLLTHMVAGDKKENSHGFEHSKYYYWPSERYGVPAGYDGVREAFWKASDEEYRQVLEIYAQKEAFKRQKNVTDKSPDFAPAKPAVFLEEPPAWNLQPPAYYQRLAQDLSALGRKFPRLESATAYIYIVPVTERYLNNEGGQFRTYFLWQDISLYAQLRNKDGFKQTLQTHWTYPGDSLPPHEDLLKKAEEFYRSASDAYYAKKAEPYLGPVLFKPAAARWLMQRLFVPNVINSKPLLVMNGTDATAGGFKDKIGQRVFSPQFTVLDRPTLREYNGRPLAGFLPVDAEGTAAQDLTLVKNGKLTDLPFSRSLTDGRKSGNGHARMGSQQRPRAGVTNLFFIPSQTFTPEELERKLLDRCRELELDYCYIVESGPENVRPSADGKTALPNITRVYVKDGRKEQVYGAVAKDLTTRVLRDVIAAGTDETTFNYEDYHIPRMSVTVPSLLVEEVELVPSDRQPDKEPFVKRPW